MIFTERTSVPASRQLRAARRGEWRAGLAAAATSGLAASVGPGLTAGILAVVMASSGILLSVGLRQAGSAGTSR